MFKRYLIKGSASAPGPSPDPFRASGPWRSAASGPAWVSFVGYVVFLYVYYAFVGQGASEGRCFRAVLTDKNSRSGGYRCRWSRPAFL